MKLGGKIENSSVDPMQKESTQLDFSIKVIGSQSGFKIQIY
jgi:hypothetical protein